MAAPAFTDGTVAHQADLRWWFDSVPRCYVWQQTAVAVPNNALTVVAFDTSVVNSPSSMWAIGAPTRIVIPETGRYAIRGQILHGSNATGYRRVMVRKNSAGDPATGTDLADALTPAATGNGVTCMAETEELLTAGDYLEMFAFQNSGGSLTPLPSGIASRVSLQARYVAAS